MSQSSARGAALAGLALAGVLVLAGCGPATPTPAPAPTKAATSTATPTPTPTTPPAPVLVPGGSAEENQPYFDKVNVDYFTANGMGSSRGIVDSLVAAGFTKQDIEVTPDRTAIDLQADSIVVSVRIDGECLIGDFRVPGYKGIVAPLLGTGGCLIGATLPIDW